MRAYEASNFTSVRGRAACHDRDRSIAGSAALGAGLARRHGCACSSVDVWVLGLGGTLETAVGRLSAKHRPQPLRSGAPGPGGRRPLAAPRGWEPWAAAGSGERNRQDLRLRALRRAAQHVNVAYTERRGTWSSTAGARHGAAGPPASPHPRWRARSARRCRKTHTCTNTKVVRHARFWGLGRAQWADPGPRGWKGCLGSASAPGQCPTALAHLPVLLELRRTQSASLRRRQRSQQLHSSGAAAPRQRC